MGDLWGQFLEGKACWILVYKNEAFRKEDEKFFSGQPGHLMLKWLTNVA